MKEKKRKEERTNCIKQTYKRRGVEWSGVEWSGVEWSGVEWREEEMDI
jgi:hypothetical protein